MKDFDKEFHWVKGNLKLFFQNKIHVPQLGLQGHAVHTSRLSSHTSLSLLQDIRTLLCGLTELVVPTQQPQLQITVFLHLQLPSRI